MALKYCEQNPIITPSGIPVLDEDFEVVGAFNPGVTTFNGEILLLVRIAERVRNEDCNLVNVPISVEGKIKTIVLNRNDSRFDFSDSRIILGKNTKLLTSMSRLVVATSKDGVNFTLHSDRGILPEDEYESFGVEDPRITKLDDTYYITYSAISEKGVCTAMQSTRDFITFTRHGIILCPENKDSALFPEKVNGKYMLVHRPSSSEFSRPEMWIAESDNLLYWGNHKRMMGVRPDMWDSARIGASSIPIKTDEGWLLLYHGADYQNRYCMGAVLLDLDEPWRVIRRSEQPFMEPVKPYETNGFFSNVVFACGCVAEKDLLKIYYGAADAYVCRADIKIKDIISTLK